MDFNDLARSGTAPEPSKVKVNQMTGPTLSLRPKTRGADNDMQDFRIELRTNKVGYQQKNYSIDTGSSSYDNTEDQSDEFIKAMESYQADFESWSRGRTDFDATGPSYSNTRQSTASSGQRPTASGKKVQNSALSAYTQNIPQIVLQTSKKTKVVPSPRSREPKADVRADIRAAYGADFLERQNVPIQRPRSQKPAVSLSQPHSPTAAQGSTPKTAVEPSQHREEYISDIRPQSGEGGSMTGRSSSASRLRANVSQQNPYDADAALSGPAKPFSVRKAAPSTSSGPRQATRPFSHSEGVRTSVSQGATAGTAPRASLDTPTSSSSSKRVIRKSATPGIAPSPLLKSSLAPSSTRGASGRAERPSSNGSDLIKSETDDRDFPIDDRGAEHYQISATNYEGIERSAKQRAATADHGVRKSLNEPGGYSYPQSTGTASGVNKNSSSSSDSRDGIAAAHSGKTPVKESSSRRGYSQSPTLNIDGLSLGKSDSEQAFLDIIQDTDNLECSFDESPILAAYLQQKNHNAHNGTQETAVTDNSTRPQSRKLYLGAEKETATSVSPKEGKSSYKTAPRSAGARYPAPHAPAGGSAVNAGPPGPMMDGPAPPLRKMSSFNEVIPQTRKWHEIPQNNNNLPDLRPPSRQSSAFPVHLADEPSNGSSLRLDDSKVGKAASPTSNKGITSPPAVSSMRWNRNGGDDDEDEGEIEESLHQDDVLSEASSVDEPPIKFKSSVKTSVPNRDAASPSQALGAASSQSVVPARTHIGIVRSAAPAEERPDTAGGDLYTPEFAIQRPPSRQKIAAQHLFEGGPPPSRIGTEKDTTRSSRAATANVPSSESLPMSRSNMRPSTTHYNPRDDGFTDLDTNEAAAVPFAIKFNNSDSADYEEFDLDDMALGHSKSQQAHHDRERDLPRRKSQNSGPGHSRSGSNASNNWADFADDGNGMHITPLSPGYRPQTMGGPVKGPRLLGVIPPGTHNAPPPRVKSAGDGLKSPSVPLRREGNNYLMTQQPHAPSGGPLQGRGPQSNRTSNNGSSGWTETASNTSSPRSQNLKIVETPLQHMDMSGSGILQMRSVSHSPSALKLNEHSLLNGNISSAGPQGSRSRDDDFLDMDSEDDMTIMTEDSGRHGMESGMSMHSLALDSSLGEDFLSLFAPGPP